MLSAGQVGQSVAGVKPVSTPLDARTRCDAGFDAVDTFAVSYSFALSF